MFPWSSLKTCLNCYTWLLNPFSRIYTGLTPKTAYIGMCAKIQILLEFSLTWIWLTCLLAFHMPWDRSDSTFHYQTYIRNPLDTLKAWGIESKRTIVHCCRNLCLSLHPFVPRSTFVFFPSFSFACELTIKRWRIEVVEAQVGDSVSPIRRHADKGCIHCNLCVILIEISFPIQ